MRWTREAIAVVGLVLACAAGVRGGQPDNADLLTVAESSGFERTATHAQVMEFVEALAGESELVHVGSLGRSAEGRDIPLVVIADPPVASPEEVGEDRSVCLLLGNIHAGEVCGKEALLMLARELVRTEDHPLLDELVIALAPIYNPDGNERMAPDNRPGQKGPREMGERANGQGLDLNRDHVKLASPEARGQLKFLRDWDPLLVIDTHTTNGSHHRYNLTYACNKHPAGDEALTALVRDEMLPAVGERVEAEHGWKTTWYGNFDRAREKWTHYPAMPRYGTPYRGLRNRVAILSEAYSYDTYENRVRSTLDFCRGCLSWVAEHRERVVEVTGAADARTVELGERAGEGEGDLVPIRTEAAVTEEAFPILGWVEEEPEDGGRPRPTDEPKEYRVDLMTTYVGARRVGRPWAYLVPGELGAVAENLKRHGIEVRELREDIELDVEAYRVESVERAERAYEGRRLVRVEATGREASRRVEAGTLVVETGQALGTLAVLLLEPESEDGLLTWGFFDGSLSAGGEYPVLRVGEWFPLHTAGARPLDEDREFGKRLTFEGVYEEGERPDLDGWAATPEGWIDDERYMQVRDDALWVVQAETGRAERFHDPELMAGALAGLAWIDEEEAEELAAGPYFRMSGDRSMALFRRDGDLYVARFDGTHALRLTTTPEAEEMATFSPDGRFVAFVRANDLYVVETTTGVERRLTTGGSDTLRNGKHDWVYFEELYGRSWKAFWWSPDSERIAFFQTDASMVPEFTIVDDVPEGPEGQEVERARYPNPGERNPEVRVGVVPAAGGAVRWVDLSGYTDGGFLVSGCGFAPDGESMWVYVQDRIQTWIDVCRVPARGGKPERVFREETGAWAEPHGSPVFLEDGSFLWLSDRSGWRHIYHYGKDGELRGQLTAGEYEVRSIEHVDEAAGEIFFTGTVDSHLANNLYRTSLEVGDEPGRPERLTRERGSHRVSLSPGGERFVDRWSSVEDRPRTVLRSRSGGLIRRLDTNPTYEHEEYDLGETRLLQIPAEEEGEEPLEGMLVLPPDFDEGKAYPAWVYTYAGPHAPVVRDTSGGGRVWEHVLASAGIVVLRGDPYAASGKGAVSAWTQYKRMGAPQLVDLERMARWLGEQEWVDASRIGMNGHSFGGYITTYVMTHSDLFAAGIAGAPVTSWYDYDTIYTERYMQTPQDNPEGYEETSSVAAAEHLSGRLLILHGTMDDNVHMQNSVRLIEALQGAGKSNFEFMLYPGYRHGIRGKHSRRLLWDFIVETMGIEGTGAEGDPASESESVETGDVAAP